MKILLALVECLISCGITLKRLIPEGKESHSVCITSERSLEEQAGTGELESYPETLTGGLTRRSERAVVGAAVLWNAYAACTRLLWGACQRAPVASRVHSHLNSVHLRRRQKLIVSQIKGAKIELSLFSERSLECSAAQQVGEEEGRSAGDPACTCGGQGGCWGWTLMGEAPHLRMWRN